MNGKEGVTEVADEFEKPGGSSRVALEEVRASFNKEGWEVEVYCPGRSRIDGFEGTDKVTPTVYALSATSDIDSKQQLTYEKYLKCPADIVQQRRLLNLVYLKVLQLGKRYPVSN